MDESCYNNIDSAIIDSPTDGAANTGGGGGGGACIDGHVISTKGGTGIAIIRWGY